MKKILSDTATEKNVPLLQRKQTSSIELLI